MFFDLASVLSGSKRRPNREHSLFHASKETWGNPAFSPSGLFFTALRRASRYLLAVGDIFPGPSPSTDREVHLSLTSAILASPKSLRLVGVRSRAFVNFSLKLTSVSARSMASRCMTVSICHSRVLVPKPRLLSCPV